MMSLERIHETHVKGRRAHVLSNWVARMLPTNASVLDVGCGDGKIAWLIRRERPDIQIEGLDVFLRDSTCIPVKSFDGHSLPCEDRSYDVITFVDVLHHTDDPIELLREAARVARRGIIIKDHLLEGVFAQPTLRFMDRVGNRRFGVRLPYNYWRQAQWQEAFCALRLGVVQWEINLHLYPWPWDYLFGRSLHFVAHLVLQKQDRQ
jgi:SAM-dependent methyltransferase